MPDPAEQLRAQIRTLQAQRRSLESKLMQPQSMLRASLLERFLRAGGAARTAPGILPVPHRGGPFEADVCQKGRSSRGAASLRRLPRLPAESAGVAAA